MELEYPGNNPSRGQAEMPAGQIQSQDFNDLCKLQVPQALTPQKKLQVEVTSGDLLEQKVDVIVNPWNSNLFRWRFLRLKSGLSGAIRQAAGPAPFSELAKAGHIPIGGAVLTSAGDLPFKGIIHVAGIRFIWGATDYTVRQSVKNALRIVQEKGFESIAFPLIGTGSGGLKAGTVLLAMHEEIKCSSYRGRVVLVRHAKPLPD